MTYLSRPGVALLGESDVTDALVVGVHLEVTSVRYVVEILYVLITNTATPRLPRQSLHEVRSCLLSVKKDRQQKKLIWGITISSPQ